MIYVYPPAGSKKYSRQSPITIKTNLKPAVIKVYDYYQTSLCIF